MVQGWKQHSMFSKQVVLLNAGNLHCITQQWVKGG